MSITKKIHVTQLVLGMYVSELDRPWLGTPFLFQGFPIRSEQELQQLRELCQHVYIDEEQARLWRESEQKDRLGATGLGVEYPVKKRPLENFSTGAINRKPPDTAQLAERVPFQQEYDNARQVYGKAREYIDSVFADVRLGRSIDVAGARELANHTVDSIVSNENALLWLTRLKNRDEYTSQHSINVCVLAVLFGRYHGLSENELRELGLGALLHDIGKMRIPLEILNKAGRPSEEEMKTLREHPQYGYEILLAAEGVSPQVQDIARSHHERIDGSGYPQGLRGDEINLYTAIVSVVDVYDAITSDRVYHMGISPHEALNMMYGMMPDTFASELMESFIRCLGIYPVGSVVELSSGEVGVVVTVNRKNQLRPTVALVMDRDKRPLDMHRMLNLELFSGDGDDEQAVSVQRLLGSDAHNVDIHQVMVGSSATTTLQ